MIKTIIIDDEEDARQVLLMAIEKYCPDLQVLAVCQSAQEGLTSIKALQPELVFLDVQMPKMSGFDLLEQLEDITFDTIFVTAYNRYAIKAIRFSALDYLLKPIDVDELVTAVERVKRSHAQKKTRYKSLLKNIKAEGQRMTRLAIPSENELILQDISAIIYCSADGSYTHLHLDGGKTLTVSKNIKEFENVLPEDNFCRIHHSTLVNVEHVKKYVRGEGGYVILSNGSHLDVSRRKKESLLAMLHRL